MFRRVTSQWTFDRTSSSCGGTDGRPAMPAYNWLMPLTYGRRAISQEGVDRCRKHPNGSNAWSESGPASLMSASYARPSASSV